MLDLYEASDYAGLKTGELEFYYGYEEVVCAKHKDNFEVCGEADCEESEWAFVVKKKGKEVLRVSTSDIDAEVEIVNQDTTAQYLLGGIGIFLSKKI